MLIVFMKRSLRIKTITWEFIGIGNLRSIKFSINMQIWYLVWTYSHKKSWLLVGGSLFFLFNVLMFWLLEVSWFSSFTLSRTLVSLFGSTASHPMGKKSEVVVFYFIGIESVLLLIKDLVRYCTIRCATLDLVRYWTIRCATLDLVRYWTIRCATLDFPAEFKCWAWRVKPSVVSRVWWSKSGAPVVTERLVPEGNWFKAHVGRLRIDIQESNHTFGE